jgi:hypothetical protein
MRLGRTSLVATVTPKGVQCQPLCRYLRFRQALLLDSMVTLLSDTTSATVFFTYICHLVSPACGHDAYCFAEPPTQSAKTDDQHLLRPDSLLTGL